VLGKLPVMNITGNLITLSTTNKYKNPEAMS